MTVERRKRKLRHGSEKSRMFREAFMPERKTVRKKEAARSQRIPWWVTLLWAAFAVVIGYTFLFSPFQMLDRCEVYGNRDVSSRKISEFVREEWSEPVLYAFPGNGFPIFRTDDMERKLLFRFPKLSTAEVRKVFPDTVTVTVTERGRIPVLCSGGACFRIGDDGRAADASCALFDENAAFVLRMEDSSGAAVSEGEILFDSGFTETAIRLEDGLRSELGLPVVFPVTMPARVSGELRFRTEAGWEIYVSTSVPPEKTVETLRLVLERELPEERRERLRYVDLRTENSAFYAFEEEKNEDADDGGEEASKVGSEDSEEGNE